MQQTKFQTFYRIEHQVTKRGPYRPDYPELEKQNANNPNIEMLLAALESMATVHSFSTKENVAKHPAIYQELNITWDEFDYAVRRYKMDSDAESLWPDITTDIKFGFTSLEQLNNWFTFGEQLFLFGLGFRIVTRKGKLVVAGRLQCIFI